MNKPISILSTAPLGREVMQEALSSGIALDVIPFIETIYLDHAVLSARVNELAKETVAVVFTSKHAVMSVAKMLKTGVENWQIYCLGNKTKITVNQLLVNNETNPEFEIIKGVGDDAEALANIITNTNVKNVVFFCGDKRLDILPDILTKAGVSIEQCIVYNTVETPRIVEKEYDRILFFSPSGVNSFFNVNNVKPGVVLYAIGNTTASAIRLHTSNKIVISSKPVKRQVYLDAVGDLSPALSKGEGEVE